MKTSVKELRRLIREEQEYTGALDELFGIGEKADFGKMLDVIMQDLANTNKKLEKAHEVAPQGTAKAIVAGLHSDLFNKIAEFRKYVEQMKGLIKKGKGALEKGTTRPGRDDARALSAATEGRRRRS